MRMTFILFPRTRVFIYLGSYCEVNNMFGSSFAFTCFTKRGCGTSSADAAGSSS